MFSKGHGVDFYFSLSLPLSHLLFQMFHEALSGTMMIGDGHVGFLLSKEYSRGTPDKAYMVNNVMGIAGKMSVYPAVDPPNTHTHTHTHTLRSIHTCALTHTHTPARPPLREAIHEHCWLTLSHRKQTVDIPHTKNTSAKPHLIAVEDSQVDFYQRLILPQRRCSARVQLHTPSHFLQTRHGQRTFKCSDRVNGVEPI